MMYWSYVKSSNVHLVTSMKTMGDIMFLRPFLDFRHVFSQTKNYIAITMGSTKLLA
jgi:hypothetical protein